MADRYTEALVPQDQSVKLNLLGFDMETTYTIAYGTDIAVSNYNDFQKEDYEFVVENYKLNPNVYKSYPEIKIPTWDNAFAFLFKKYGSIIKIDYLINWCDVYVDGLHHRITKDEIDENNSNFNTNHSSEFITKRFALNVAIDNINAKYGNPLSRIGGNFDNKFCFIACQPSIVQEGKCSCRNRMSDSANMILKNLKIDIPLEGSPKVGDFKVTYGDKDIREELEAFFEVNKGITLALPSNYVGMIMPSDLFGNVLKITKINY